jgi:signal transduction histidine kinase
MANLPEIEQYTAFLNLGPSDIEHLAELKPVLEKHAPKLVDAFYAHLSFFPETRSLIENPEIKKRLLEIQRKYLISLGEVTLGQAYVDRRRLIGITHERLGVEPRWYLGAYALYRSMLIPLIIDSYPKDPAKAQATLIALQKILSLDAQLAMEAYIGKQQQTLRSRSDQLEITGLRLAQDVENQKAELYLTETRARAAEELASVAALVAGLAHEIGTPMGVIQGHAKLLEPAVSGDDAKWRLRTIQEQIGRISKIIQTLLNMARPGKSQQIPVALGPLVEMTLSFLREKLAANQIDARITGDSTVSALGDPERLQQLFLNLFINAVDAMPGGGRLQVIFSTTDHGETEILVIDDGQGVPKRDLSQIFDPFFTSKEAGSGSGLGLMVAKGIMGDHGGEISVTSQEGEGTRFRLRFPAADQ